MLIDAIIKLHNQIQHTKLGADAVKVNEEREQLALNAEPLIEMKGLLR